ncbi:hypothetical protein R1flu_012175 [Riccia fluitans]|uniref:Reverse transcriptase domain-containing protein n=1 Tax=Riccia fluitans TaxID=41844 RepID=A0ABD1ZA39_9MARC
MGFVHKFWKTGTLTWKQQTGVIKLIPKEGDRQRIKNWRPLTLLNTGYKLISKVMANRMKLVLPEIVDSQQKGFESVRFSQEFPIERGVKQGCPLAPLLFSLSTEPLMALMKKQERDGNLEGLHLTGSKTALYNLFVDDSGVFLKASQTNFRNLQQTISMYERISGTKLNLEKSTVIPVGMSSTPQWLKDTGCYIAREGEPIRYLGYPIGWRVPESQLLNFITGKLERKLGNWTYQLLTFEGRIIVLKHVIRSIPAHLLSCMALDPQTLKKMEQTCRRFVWGKNAQGKEKIPLLAWEALQPTKSDGGLDIPSFAVQGEAQKLRQVLRMVHHPGEDWMCALGALLRWKTAKGREAASMRHWDIEEILMANCPSKIQGAKTATGLLKVWVKVRTNLEIQRNDFTPRGETSAEAAIKIGEQQGWLMANDAKTIKATLRRHKIKTIRQWADWASRNNARDTADRWRDFRFLTEDLSCHIPRTACFIDTVDAAFRGQDPGKQVPFALLTRATWLDRNQVTYAQQRTRTLVSITLKFAVEMLNSLRGKLEPATKAAKKLKIAGELLQIAACRAGESEHAIEPATQVTEVVEVADWEEEDQTQHSQPVNLRNEEGEIT